MTRYWLYAESGPQRKRTMVHVLELLGCVASGRTTQEAFEATPAAIRRFLDFQVRHGMGASSAATIETELKVHVSEGSWIGQGDPDCGFALDFEPLNVLDLEIYRRRLGFMHQEVLEVIRRVDRSDLAARPASGGRTSGHIAAHIAEAHYAYLQAPLSKPPGMAKVLREVKESSDLAGPLSIFFAMLDGRLEVVSEQEQSLMVAHGKKTWTARRALRRMLEHEWEHLSELSDRHGWVA